MFVHFLLFFGSIWISFSFFRLPSSEVSTHLFLIIEFGLIYLQDVGPFFIFNLFGLFKVIKHVQILQSFFDFLNLFLLLIFLLNIFFLLGLAFLFLLFLLLLTTFNLFLDILLLFLLNNLLDLFFTLRLICMRRLSTEVSKSDHRLFLYDFFLFFRVNIHFPLSLFLLFKKHLCFT